ncbi:MAG: hypothetical protein ACRERU_10520, partial [Methylococcales bacterium]
MPNHIEDWLTKWVSDRPKDEKACAEARDRLSGYVKKNYLEELTDAAEMFLKDHPQLISAIVVSQFIDNGPSLLLKKSRERVLIKNYLKKDAVNRLSDAINCFTKNSIEQKPTAPLAAQFRTHVIHQFKVYAIALWLSAPLEPKPEPKTAQLEKKTSSNRSQFEESNT